MKRQHFFAMLMALANLTACTSNSASADNYIVARPYLPVTLSVEGDNQGMLPEFPLSDNVSHYRAFIQASPNERYRLRVTNNSDQRVGLVIAVDGRNIISGKKSYLRNNERMYILNPHDSADYDGWRTSTSQTNRFFFTHVADSYAAAWGDTSAMGVIAMAVYPERPRPEVYYNKDKMMRGSESARVAPAADAAAAPAPGTGYGENSYSPVVSVDFEPSSEQMEKIVLKYEWRETLCRKGIAPECSSNEGRSPNNRLWQPDHNRNDRQENNDFAPPPPSHY
jgi:hypothetical protein